tara:strand:- start:40 stop:594 length:555 start_codon:yes stop_codon:yes gene_type:complete
MYKVVLFFFLALSSQSIFAQTHTIEELFVELSGEATADDFSNNTYYHAIDSCSVSWQVISDSVPDGWLVSFCFPNCYEPGVTSASSVFSDNSDQYLNCHIYPNNVTGTGVVKMEITTNNTHKDTVVWSATALENLFLTELDASAKGKILNVYNLEGKMISKSITDQIVLVEFENGIIEKRFVMP